MSNAETDPTTELTTGNQTMQTTELTSDIAISVAVAVAEVETGTAAQEAAELRERKQKTGRARRHQARQAVFELALPLGGYYLLVGLGASQWAALAVSSLLVVPWIVYGMVKNRRIEALPVFTLVLLLAGALVSMITGDPRLLLVRDSWVTAVLGLWALGSVPTRRPFILSAARSVVVAKIGEAGAREWESQWDTDAEFRTHVRVVSTVWGLGFALDSVVRIVLAYTLPINAVPLVSTLQWLVVLAGLFIFHYWYITRHNLKV